MTFCAVAKLAIRCAVIAVLSGNQAVSAQETPSQQEAPPKQETLLQKLLRVSGLTSAPSQMRGGDEDIQSGDIWVADLATHKTRSLTRDSDYRSPVFAGDGTLYALQGETLVRIPLAGGSPVPLQKLPGAAKLVGFSHDDDLVVLLAEPHAGSPIALISVTSGQLTPVPYQATSADEQRMLAQVRCQDRVYGETTLYTKEQSKRGMSQEIEWSDVYIKKGDAEPQNVSACDGDDCVQPPLAPDGRRIAYVKSQS
jgi:hypothetical protein